MSVELSCPICDRKLRVPATGVGKVIRCPGCRSSFRLGATVEHVVTAQMVTAVPGGKSDSPSSSSLLTAELAEPDVLGKDESSLGSANSLVASTHESATEVNASHVDSQSESKVKVQSPSKSASRWREEVEEPNRPWRLKGDDGEEFGPITKEELDGWYAEGRLNSECQILQVGWRQWKWADEVYPSLGEQSEEGKSDIRPEPPLVIDDFGIPQPVPDDPFANDENPFRIPDDDEDDELPDGEGLTGSMRQSIADSRPWTALLTAVEAVLAVATAWYGAVVFWHSVPLGRTALIFMGFSLLLCGGLYCWSAYSLYRLNRRMSWFTKSPSNRALRDVLVAQKLFWRRTGAITVAAIFLAAVTTMLVRWLHAPVSFF